VNEFRRNLMWFVTRLCTEPSWSSCSDWTEKNFLSSISESTCV